MDTAIRYKAFREYLTYTERAYIRISERCYFDTDTAIDSLGVPRGSFAHPMAVTVARTTLAVSELGDTDEATHQELPDMALDSQYEFLQHTAVPDE